MHRGGAAIQHPHNFPARGSQELGQTINDVDRER